jgi:hypothetical protein
MLELVAAAALGVLPESDRAQVDAFLLADPAARTEFEELRAAADLVGLAADEPLDAVYCDRMKSRLLAAVRATQPVRVSGPLPPRPARATVWTSVLAAAAALVLALISAIQNVGLRSDLADAERRAATLQRQVTAERNAVERDGRILADLTAADAKSTSTSRSTRCRPYRAATSIKPGRFRRAVPSCHRASRSHRPGSGRRSSRFRTTRPESSPLRSAWNRRAGAARRRPSRRSCSRCHNDPARARHPHQPSRRAGLRRATSV